MACSACAKTITQAVIDLEPLARVKTDPKTKRVTVESNVSESSVRKAIAAAGYPAA